MKKYLIVQLLFSGLLMSEPISQPSNKQTVSQSMPKLSEAAKKVKPGIYRHYRTGNLYRVVGVGFNEATHEEMVIYQALYGEYTWWLRAVSVFLEEVEVEGKKQSRFSFVGAMKNDSCC